jgi:hypothetical protein
VAREETTDVRRRGKYARALAGYDFRRMECVRSGVAVDDDGGFDSGGDVAVVMWMLVLQ